jgi:hypothetical protein
VVLPPGNLKRQPEQVEYEVGIRRAADATDKGDVMTVRGFVVMSAALASACTVGNAGTVKDRMSAEYSCPADSITVTTLPGNAYRAEGCGHTATFACGPEGTTPTCTKEAGSSTPPVDAGAR